MKAPSKYNNLPDGTSLFVDGFPPIKSCKARETNISLAWLEGTSILGRCQADSETSVPKCTVKG